MAGVSSHCELFLVLHLDTAGSALSLDSPVIEDEFELEKGDFAGDFVTAVSGFSVLLLESATESSH